MASNATIFKATLQIADVDRHYYQDHTVTLARHPSETDERMMVRLLAFARHAHDALSFGRGLSTPIRQISTSWPPPGRAMTMPLPQRPCARPRDRPS